MKTVVPKYEMLTFVEGETYETKFQTKEQFILKEIVWYKNKMHSFKGIYVKHPHLGIVPLALDRLKPKQRYIADIEVCDNCNTPI